MFTRPRQSTKCSLKPGFHIIVRVVPVAPVFSNYVQATGIDYMETLQRRPRTIQKDRKDRDDRDRLDRKMSIRKTKTIARDRKYFNGNHFRATGTNKKTETTQNIPQCTVLCSVLCSKNGWINRIIFKQRTFYGISAEIRLPI